MLHVICECIKTGQYRICFIANLVTANTSYLQFWSNWTNLKIELLGRLFLAFSISWNWVLTQLFSNPAADRFCLQISERASLSRSHLSQGRAAMSTFPNPVTKTLQPPDPPYFGENQPKTLRLYPLSTFSP